MSDSVPLAPIDAILGSMGGPIPRAMTYIPLTQFESRLKKVETEVRTNIEPRLKKAEMEVRKTQKAVNAINKEISSQNATFDEHEVRLDNVVGAVEDFQDTVGQLQDTMASMQNTMASMQKQVKGLLKEQKKGQKKGQPETKDSANGRFIKEVLRQLERNDINQDVAATLIAAKRPCGAQRFKSLRGLKQAATIAGIDYVL
jgi:uncharacterized coiled-coil protein SlyX